MATLATHLVMNSSPDGGTHSIGPMPLTMQEAPLNIAQLFRRAERLFGDRQIHWMDAGRPVSMTYGAWASRTRRLTAALLGLGLDPGARVATYAWNTVRHFEASFAVPLAGMVFHPLNLRLTDDQLRYIVNDAQDEVIIVERSLYDRLAPHLGYFRTVRHLIVMDDSTVDDSTVDDSTVDDSATDDSVSNPSTTLVPEGIQVLDYEQFLTDAVEGELPFVEETQAASICYTSGTTGNPKGVVYSHRSLWLHTMSLQQVDVTAICERDTVLPLVQLFHANAWDLGLAAASAGADLVLCGSDLSGRAIADLFEQFRVTFSTAVPAVWARVLPELRDRHVPGIRMLCSGGSAVPARLSELCHELTGAPIMQVWGMTETLAFASMARERAHIDPSDQDAIARVSSSQGIPVAGVEFRIVEHGTTDELPWDGAATGELQCRGPWVTARYYGEAQPYQSVTTDGWFRTGDAATIDPDGYIRLRDRLKDLIKSGGEWVPSVEVERALQEHPDVENVAVIGVQSLRWDERPIAIVSMARGRSISGDDLLDWLRPRISKLWLPEEIHVLDELPLTSVGKIDKKALRRDYAQDVRP